MTARGASALLSSYARQTTRCWSATLSALQPSLGSSPKPNLSLPFVASSWSPRPSGEKTPRISRSLRSIFADSNPYPHCSFTKARMTQSLGSRTSRNTRSRCLTPFSVGSMVGGTSSIRTPSPNWWPTFEASLVLRLTKAGAQMQALHRLIFEPLPEWRGMQTPSYFRSHETSLSTLPRTT